MRIDSQDLYNLLVAKYGEQKEKKFEIVQDDGKIMSIKEDDYRRLVVECNNNKFPIKIEKKYLNRDDISVMQVVFRRIVNITILLLSSEVFSDVSSNIRSIEYSIIKDKENDEYMKIEIYRNKGNNLILMKTELFDYGFFQLIEDIIEQFQTEFSKELSMYILRSSKGNGVLLKMTQLYSDILRQYDFGQPDGDEYNLSSIEKEKKVVYVV